MDKPRKPRTLSVPALLNTTLVLFFFGLFGLTAILFQVVVDRVKTEQPVKIFLRPSVQAGKAHGLEEQFAQQAYVARTEYISPDDGLDELMKEMGEEFAEEMEVGDISPIPATIHLFLKPEYINVDSFVKIRNELLVNYKWQLESVNYPINELETLNQRRQLVRAVALVLGAVLAFLTFFLVANATRLVIHARRLSFRTMQLVGAKPGFIRRPFVRLGLLQGLLGAVLAAGLLVGLLLALNGYLQNEYGGVDLGFVLRSLELKLFLLFLVGFGAATGLLSSRYAVNRVLNKSVDYLA